MSNTRKIFLVFLFCLAITSAGFWVFRFYYGEKRSQQPAVIVSTLTCSPSQIDLSGALPDKEREGLAVNLLDGANREISRALDQYKKDHSLANAEKLQKLASERKPLFLEVAQRNIDAAVFFVLLPAEREFLSSITKDCVESRSRAQGVLQVMHIDLMDESARDQYTLATSDGKFIDLRFFGGIPQELVSGVKVRLEGLRLDDSLLVDTRESDSIRIIPDSQKSGFISPASAAVADAFGVQKTLVLMANFRNTTQPSLTKSYLTDMVFNKIDSYFKEVSYGNISFSGDVFGWYALPIDQTCLTDAVLTEAMKAANADVILPIIRECLSWRLWGRLADGAGAEQSASITAIQLPTGRWICRSRGYCLIRFSPAGLRMSSGTGLA